MVDIIEYQVMRMSLLFIIEIELKALLLASYTHHY